MPDTRFLLEYLIFAGAAVAWGVWELWSLHRDSKKPPSKDSSGHPEG